MDPLLNCAVYFHIYIILSSTLFLGCYCSTLRISGNNPIASFSPRNIKHYSFDEQSTDIYITWDPPLNYLLPKSSGLSMNIANAKSDADAALNRLSVPLHDRSDSNSKNHPQYNLVNKNAHELTNTSHVSANLFEINSTKNLTTKEDKRNEDNQSQNSLGSIPDTKDGTYDVYGFVKSYTVFCKQQQNPEVHLIKVGANQTWVLLSNMTADNVYEISIRVSYSNKKQVNSTKYVFTVDGSSISVCKCHLIGTRDGHTACNLDTGHPCYCSSGYGGLFCDRCQPKHYSLEGKCLPCPCTSEFGSFNCRLFNNKPVCNCLNGYTGEKCNRCSNGYFKYYRTCAKCICHNNVDLLSPDICDPDIGACKHCLYNTTGFSCDECLPGFVGDPILHKNCTKPNSSTPKIPTSHSKASFPLSLKVGLPLIILFICIIIGILILQRHRFYHKLQPFWTIELKDDHDSVTLSTNDGQEFGGASLSSRAASNHDDMDFYAKHISHQGGMQYSPLRETM